MNIDFPVHLDDRGHTAATSDDEHVRDLIEQLLFTSPGERVNRPDFGSGLLQLVHSPNSPELAAAVQFSVQAGLQRWLGDLVEIRALQATAEDSTLRVVVKYIVLASGAAHTDALEREVM